MFFVNQRLKVIPDDLATPDDFAALSPAIRLKVRDAFVANVGLIESFVDENPAHLSDDELDIVRSWRHLVAGQFDVASRITETTPEFVAEVLRELAQTNPRALVAQAEESE